MMTTPSSPKPDWNHVIHLGPLIVDSRHAHNSYLFRYNNLNILFDLPPVQILDLLLISIRKEMEISEITHLVIQSMTMSSINVIIELIDEGFKGEIITNEYFSRQIRNAGLPVSIHTIEAMNFKLMDRNEMILKFVPMVFLPYPEMFMSYAPSLFALFSSTLFSSFYNQQISPSLDHLQKSMFAYHKYMMPSSLYIQPPLRKINVLDVRQAYPLMGYLISKQIFPAIYAYEKALDFYNNYQVFTYSESGEKVVNYKEIINHMLNQLQKSVSRIEILNAFIGTPFSLQSDPIMLKNSTLEDYKMWHGFFEHVFIQRGIAWIAMLEPLVNRYHEQYGIELPTVYRSRFIEMSLHSDQLSKSNQDLEKQIAELNAEIEETKDSIMRCPITRLYNEDFFRELLKKDLEHHSTPDYTMGFILVQLDQLNDINTRYGKETGNEAIRNMAYQLQHIDHQGALFFKENGPGIYIYKEKTTAKQLEILAVKARSAINESHLFIEDVTASVSVVSFNEIDGKQEINEQIRDIFTLLHKRINIAKKKGANLIIDQQFELPKSSEGVILLIDEDEVNLNMLNRIFKRVGFDVRMAKGVDIAKQILNEEQVDIIISEINLSKMDGFSFKQMLNESRDYSEIPFIMVSHNKTLENIKRGNTHHVNLILEKPIVPEELIGHVQRFREWKKRL